MIKGRGKNKPIENFQTKLKKKNGTKIQLESFHCNGSKSKFQVYGKGNIDWLRFEWIISRLYRKRKLGQNWQNFQNIINPSGKRLY
jgi:hypothetical protein